MTQTRQWRTVRFEVLERIEKLPSLNNVVLEFLTLTKREFLSARDFEAVISKDQALTARLLKVANCGLFGRPRSINSIPEAVVLVGLENLKRIVLAVSAEGLILQNLKNYDYNPHHGFWLHALAVAHATRVVAEESPRCPLRPEEAFVAGLLHDIGKLVIDDFLDSGPGIAVSLQQEREAAGLDHVELAEFIFKQWNLPEAISDAVCLRGEGDPSDVQPGATALVLAQGICKAWGVGQRDALDLSREISSEPFLMILKRLGLAAEKWDQVIWDIRQSLVHLESMFLDT